MGYTHKGVVRQNGIVDFCATLTNSSDMVIRPDDDGFHLADYAVGDFEWWYFDLFDEKSGCFVKIVIHIGTDPLKTRIFPQLAISVSTSGSVFSLARPYSFSDLGMNTQKCNITMKEEVRIWTENQLPLVYFIKINIPGLQCNLKLVSDLEGWKPLGSEVPFRIGRKSGIFSWTVPVPKARVEGNLMCQDTEYILGDAIGYHDHNFIRVDKKHPLYLDELVTRWYWGKCHAERYTLVFMDTYFRSNRMLSLMVADRNKIIHSSNNLINCLVSSTGFDQSLKSEYPTSLTIQCKETDFPCQATFSSARLVDSKDLLEGVNPLLRWLIKKLIARPAYHGIFASVSLYLLNQSWDGFGNYETMVFRNH